MAGEISTKRKTQRIIVILVGTRRSLWRVWLVFMPLTELPLIRHHNLVVAFSIA